MKESSSDIGEGSYLINHNSTSLGIIAGRYPTCLESGFQRMRPASPESINEFVN
jgi:hypothetical protein